MGVRGLDNDRFYVRGLETDKYEERKTLGVRGLKKERNIGVRDLDRDRDWRLRV